MSRAWQRITQASHSLQGELSKEMSSVRKFASSWVGKRAPPDPATQEEISEVAAVYSPRVGYEVVSWNSANLAEMKKTAVKTAGEGDKVDREIASMTRQVKKTWKAYTRLQRELGAVADILQGVQQIQRDVSSLSEQVDTINYRLTELDILNSQVQLSRAKMEELRRFSSYRQSRQGELVQMNSKLSLMREAQRDNNERQKLESLALKKQFLEDSFQQQMSQYKEYGTLRPGAVDRKFQGSSEYDKQLGEVEIEPDPIRNQDLTNFLSNVTQPEILQDIETASPSKELANEQLMKSLLDQKIEGKKIGDVEDPSPPSSGLDPVEKEL